MKKLMTLTLAAFALNAANAQDKTKTETFKVYGNCGMCEVRIEKAAKIDGVTAADWDEETKLVKVSYDPAVTNVAKVQKAIAAVGHDTATETAEDAVYKTLPGCCKYERKKGDKTTDNHSHH